MRLSNRIFIVAGALAMPALALGGCSSGKSTLSKAQFITQADAICAATTTKVNAIPQLGASATAADAIVPVQQALAIVQPALTQLAALHAAPADFAVLNKNLITPTKTQDAAANAFVTAMKQANGNTAAQQAAITKFTSATNDPNQDAEDSALAKYGFNACSKTNESS
jgi:hypothetical protein